MKSPFRSIDLLIITISSLHQISPLPRTFPTHDESMMHALKSAPLSQLYHAQYSSSNLAKIEVKVVSRSYIIVATNNIIFAGRSNIMHCAVRKQYFY